MDNYT